MKKIIRKWMILIFYITANIGISSLAVTDAMCEDYEIQSSQSEMDGYKADKRTYNTNPDARPGDGYNKWLDNQIERSRSDRDRAIQRDLRNKEHRRGR